MPFVLDEGDGRVAVRVSTTEGKYFDTSAKTVLGWVVASPGEPGALADSTFVVVARGVGDTSQD